MYSFCEYRVQVLSIPVLLLASSLISNFPSPITNSWVTLPSTAITIGVTITFMFYSFFSSVSLQGPGTNLSFRLPSVLPSVLAGLVFWQDAKVYNSASSLFFVDYHYYNWKNIFIIII